MDSRTTREVEETRKNANRKPYRSKELKAEAKKRATKRQDGAWRCDVRVLYHKRKDE